MNEQVKSIPRIVPPWPFEAYAHIISRLSEEDGRGYLVTFPDLPGCMADGETEAEAVQNGRKAFIAVVSALADMGRDIPAPSFSPEYAAAPGASGKFVARVPKSIHAKLTTRAKAEGVSLNTLVLTLIAEGLGRRESHA
jgi:antitoxin HicB